jgi:hypothetical protein
MKQMIINRDNLTVDDICLLETGRITDVKEFLVRNSNWTKEEIGSLKITDFPLLAEQIKSALDIPKV